MSGILVLVEHTDGRIERASLELLGEACRLGRKLGKTVAAVVLSPRGASLSDALAHHGAETVYVIDDARSSHYDPNVAVASIARLCTLHEPVLVMFAATTTGSDVAARLATTEGWPLVARCVNFEVRDGTIRPIRALAHQSIHGSYAAVATGPMLVTIAPDTLGLERPDPGRQARLERVAAAARRSAVEVRDLVPADPRTLDLSEAERVVGVGRGIGTRANLRLVEAFADAIGASIACTRPLVDLGWLPHVRQIGQTGISIKPQLYVACGISGATQHVLGIREAGTIVAINTDPGAPIFDIADLGVVGDVTEVLPRLTAKCRSACGG